ncbi:MAG TPA: hypothetical protein VFB96_13525 [Pirellulaceae bacterium]|nr:hypothetical protein [Pirellulaceae bacterium]
MTLALAFPLLLALLADADPLAEAAMTYLQRCEEAKAATIKAKESEIKALAADSKVKLKAARAELRRLTESPAALLPLPLPPQKGAMGIFQPASAQDGRGGKSVDVLEIVDEDEAIVRAWYVPPASAGHAASEEPTFVDLWIQGIDTAGLTARSPVTLPQVFHVTGSKLFDTTCGKRSLPLLVPVEIERYRAGGK